MTFLKRENVIAGLFFMALALSAGVISTGYEAGDAAHMGPGYFPKMLSIVLFFLGLVILVATGAKSEETRLNVDEIRAVAAVVSAVVLFAVLLRPLGMVVTMIVVAVASSLGSREFKLMRSLAIAVSLSAFCYLVFSLLLDLRMPVLPFFMRTL